MAETAKRPKIVRASTARRLPRNQHQSTSGARYDIPKPSTANMTIALTRGAPSGIGPEITAGAWQALRATGPAFVVLADPALLSPLGPIRIVTEPDSGGFSDAIPVLPIA